MKVLAVPFFLVCLFGAALLAVCVWPQLDLIASGFFYIKGQGFYLENQPVFLFLHMLALRGAWALGGVFLLAAPLAYLVHYPIIGINSKGWLFLLLALLLGPVLLANGILKDHWGRPRPHEVTAFGGPYRFTPALLPQPEARRNESFVAGDAAFGFFLPSFAYLAPLPTRRRLSRGLFWGGMLAGACFGFTRLVMGGHFLSDILFAALLMLLVSAGLHAAMFGRNATREYWRVWIA